MRVNFREHLNLFLGNKGTNASLTSLIIEQKQTENSSYLRQVTFIQQTRSKQTRESNTGHYISRLTSSFLSFTVIREVVQYVCS